MSSNVAINRESKFIYSGFPFVCAFAALGTYDDRRRHLVWWWSFLASLIEAIISGLSLLA